MIRGSLQVTAQSPEMSLAFLRTKIYRKANLPNKTMEKGIVVAIVFTDLPRASDRVTIMFSQLCHCTYHIKIGAK